MLLYDKATHAFVSLDNKTKKKKGASFSRENVNSVLLPAFEVLFEARCCFCSLHFLHWEKITESFTAT